MNNQFTHPKERIRFAILTFFFSQGLCMASWASRIPDFKDIFTANYAFYWGLILFMIPIGKFVAIPLAGYLVSKLGSRSMVQVSILGYASSLLCVGLAHEVYLLGFLLFCFGVFLFVALGQAKVSIFIALLCKVILLVSLALMLPHLMGVVEVYAAEGISDATAAICCTTIFAVQFPKIMNKLAMR